MNLTRNLANPEQIFEVVNDIFIQTEVQRLSEQRICERKPIFKSIDLQFLNKDLDSGTWFAVTLSDTQTNLKFL